VTEAAHSIPTPGATARAAAPGLLIVAASATGGAVYLIAVSKIAPHPVAQSILTALVCFTFVGTGVAAIRLRPYARFGSLLAAVGFASLISVLHEANRAVLYTLGVLASNVVFAVLVHALLAFPSGRLRSRTARVLVIAAYVDMLALQAAAVLVDPLTRYHSDHPRNVLLVASHSGLATAIEEVEAGVAAAIAIAVVVVLTRRVRAATAAARRQLVPVLYCGETALLLFSFGLILTPLSSEAGLVGFSLGVIAALALPAAFLLTLVQGRLSQAAVGELLLELHGPGPAADLEDALRRALGDPSLRLGRLTMNGTFIDCYGATIESPRPGGVQVSLPILHQGEPVGTLVHDRSLRLRRELLDAVTAAAGFALANERALHAAELAEKRHRALLEAMPDVMMRVARDGTYLDVRSEDLSQLLQPPEELIGRNVRDVLPPELAENVIGWIDQTLAEGGVRAFEYEIEIHGERRWKESRMIPSGPDEAVTVVRDFTEQRRAEAGQRRLAAEQAALRRVATLVAGNAPPDRVFQSVTEEVCRLLGLRTAVLARFESPSTATIVGKYGSLPDRYELGFVAPLVPGATREVLRTGAPIRVQYADLSSGTLQEFLELGYRGEVGVPITVAGATWGALVVVLQDGEVIPPATEHRLRAFAELVGLAVASADARNEVSASRRRIVEASDTERKRLERNLHDGAQQRLVAFALGLRVAQSKLRKAPDEAERLLGQLAEELSAAIVELRELAQGIHPAVLTERGLAAAVEVLAARAPLSVELDIDLPERLPEAVETAAYYAVSEALANVAKHARAHTARVTITWSDDLLVVEVADDGTGGADLELGTGLRGLCDRVEALGGQLSVESSLGNGTLVRGELPVPLGNLAAFARER
jgi:PAS domain S-box-containing protein